MYHPGRNKTQLFLQGLVNIGLAWLLILSMARVGLSEIPSLVEGFNGRLENGFDNSGWVTIGDSGISDGNWMFENSSLTNLDVSYDSIGRFLDGFGSLEAEVRFSELNMSLIPMTAEGHSLVSQYLFFGPHRPPVFHVNLGIRFDLKWVIGFTQADENGESLGRDGIKEIEVLPVTPGSPASFSVGWNMEEESVTVTYDNDTLDTLPPVEVTGQFGIVGLPSQDIYYELLVATEALGDQYGSVDSIVIRGTGETDGDYDASGTLDVADLDILSSMVGIQDSFGDLDASGVTDTNDLAYWLHTLTSSYFGDANFDGEFNSADLVNIFRAGEYEDNFRSNSIWSTGDWNGDGEFTTSDLVLAFQDGGYELGPREAVRSVPEPNESGVAILSAFLVGWLVRRRRFMA